MCDICDVQVYVIQTSKVNSFTSVNKDWMPVIKFYIYMSEKIALFHLTLKKYGG